MSTGVLAVLVVIGGLIGAAGAATMASHYLDRGRAVVGLALALLFLVAVSCAGVGVTVLLSTLAGLTVAAP